MQGKNANLSSIVDLANDNHAIAAAMGIGNIGENVIESWIDRLGANSFETNLLALLEVQPWIRTGLNALETTGFAGVSEKEVEQLYYHGCSIIMKPLVTLN